MIKNERQFIYDVLAHMKNYSLEMYISVLELRKALSVGGIICEDDERRLTLCLFLRKLGLKLK